MLTLFNNDMKSKVFFVCLELLLAFVRLHDGHKKTTFRFVQKAFPPSVIVKTLLSA